MGVNAINFISGLSTDIMLYAYNLLYIIPLCLLEQINISRTNYLYKLIIITTSVIVFQNAIYSNELYLKKELENQNTLSVMTRLIDRLENSEGYVIGETPVVLLGNINESSLSKDRLYFDNRGFGTNSNFNITYRGTESSYFHDYLSYPINIVSEEILDNNTMSLIKTMPSFPAKNSCVMINGIMVVKLSE